MLKSPIIIIFCYFKMALLNDSDSSLKSIERLPGSAGFYVLKQTHLLFDVLNSEQMHSEKPSSKSLILLQIIPLLTNTITPPPFLTLSRLALTW